MHHTQFYGMHPQAVKELADVFCETVLNCPEGFGNEQHS